ncbi:hypothetical protein TBR22_A38060 [Luteitalea sp. TBR-22]|uniref:hypothetical protein n=1 Tax=Luteitalea sp. TBR-22 TaxID=2802971 RepID=UPI001AF3202C|nr:hypothetical protein [Luteitalea sp. TBR-22]BCS34578.1 hypothetical protein TBR22_A38060 [Luteitalea sp. TBR-22]
MAGPLGSLLARFGAGRGLWSIVAFVFPSAALVQGEHYGIAVLLFVAETAIALALLGVRLAIAWRASAAEPEVRARLKRTRRSVPGALLMILVGLVWGVGFAGVALGLSPPDDLLDTMMARARPMVGGLLLAAILDTVVAPVRSPAWLETGIAWQASRASVVIVSILIGLPIAYFFGGQGMLWSFLGLRLFADLGGMKPGERERIRATMFDGPEGIDPAARNTPKAPPTFSAGHARHDRNDPTRLPE